MQEMKFCQYCGNNELDIEVTLDRESGKKYRVHCRQCGANGPLRNDEDNAILWWNNRINEEPDIPQERPTFVDMNIDPSEEPIKLCPFAPRIKADDIEDEDSMGICQENYCMMWVSVGEDKGRCGLVNTMYINSTVYSTV